MVRIPLQPTLENFSQQLTTFVHPPSPLSSNFYFSDSSENKFRRFGAFAPLHIFMQCTPTYPPFFWRCVWLKGKISLSELSIFGAPFYVKRTSNNSFQVARLICAQLCIFPSFITNNVSSISLKFTPHWRKVIVRTWRMRIATENKVWKRGGGYLVSRWSSSKKLDWSLIEFMKRWRITITTMNETFSDILSADNECTSNGNESRVNFSHRLNAVEKLWGWMARWWCEDEYRFQNTASSSMARNKLAVVICENLWARNRRKYLTIRILANNFYECAIV